MRWGGGGRSCCAGEVLTVFVGFLRPSLLRFFILELGNSNELFGP